MIEMTIAYALKDLLEDRKASFGAPITGLTVQSVSGSVIHVTGGPITGDWQSGVVEVVTPGNSVNRFNRAMIDSASGGVISLATPFIHKRVPAPGDIVKIYGGPLKDAKVYVGDPENVKKDYDGGMTNLITISPTSQDLAIKTASARRPFSLHGTNVVVGFEGTAEIARRTGTGALEDIIKKKFDLPTLAYQYMSQIAVFRAMENMRIQLLGGISAGYLVWERGAQGNEVGSGVMFDACAIEFDIQYN